MRIIAYAADAAVHCPECTERQYGPDNFVWPAYRVDSEGNEVFPISSVDECHSTNCDTCGEILEGMERRAEFEQSRWRALDDLELNLALAEGEELPRVDALRRTLLYFDNFVNVICAQCANLAADAEYGTYDFFPETVEPMHCGESERCSHCDALIVGA